MTRTPLIRFFGFQTSPLFAARTIYFPSVGRCVTFQLLPALVTVWDTRLVYI